MSNSSRISKAFEGALKLPLDTTSKYIVFSDCHRGTGKANDNFLKNEFLYIAALKYYYDKEYTYLELGDGDELWENRSFNAIKSIHSEVFETLSAYYREHKFYSVYGNHDIVKKNKRFCDRYCNASYCTQSLCSIPLFPKIHFYQGIILENKTGKNDIYLTHGHQADFLNSVLWRLSRFLVRYIWQPLEIIGVPDPTSAAKNNTKKEKTEKKLALWARQNNHILITGHTHHPMIGNAESLYFNTGSCVSPSGITCIEIENNYITLAKWALGTHNNRTLYVKREILGDPVRIQ